MTNKQENTSVLSAAVCCAISKFRLNNINIPAQQQGSGCLITDTGQSIQTASRLRRVWINLAVAVPLLLLFFIGSQAIGQTDIGANYTDLRVAFQKMKRACHLDNSKPERTIADEDPVLAHLRKGFAALSKVEGIVSGLATHLVNSNRKELFSQSLNIVSLLKQAKSHFEQSEVAFKEKGGGFIIWHGSLLSEDSYKALHGNIEFFERELRKFIEQAIRPTLYSGIIDDPAGRKTDIQNYQDNPFWKEKRVSMVKIYDGKADHIIIVVINYTTAYAKVRGQEKEVIIHYAYGEDRYRFYAEEYAAKNKGVRSELMRTGGNMYQYDQFKYRNDGSLVNE